MRYLVLIIIISWLSGCGTQRYAPVYERTIVHSDTTIYLPGAVVRDTLPGVVIHARDSVFTERIVTDATGRAELRYIRDALGRLQVEARCKPDTIVVQRVRERIVDMAVETPHPPWWRWALIGFGVGVICTLGLILVIRW